MPRVDAGWVAVDASKLLGLEGDRLEGFARLAVETRAVLVTRPSIVTGRVGYRSVRLTLGVGSLVFPPGTPVEGVPLSRPEWVDGCHVTGRINPSRGEGGERRSRGVIVSRDVDDPVGLAGNGHSGEFVFRVCPGIGILYLEDNVVASYSGQGYCVGLLGPLGEFLSFIAALYTPCRGR